MRPNFFAERPQPFENFTHERGSLLDPLVTSIYEDHNDVLWIGSMRGLNRIDRRTASNIASPNIGNEILSILEDHHGVLFCGTFHRGLIRIDRQRGKLTPYSPQSTNHQTDPIMRLMYDHNGTLWAAQYGGVGRYDPATESFTMYTPDNQNTVQYQEIKEDREGFFWLGGQKGQTGLHRFDPRTAQFKIYEHDPDDPQTLSDDRVNSIHIDHLGTLWVGTQNGLGRLDPASGTFKNYYEKDGLAGGVVSCILEDKQGVLWMSTNNGLSSFNPQLQKFEKFTVADGLPGQDLTGWGACYQSPSGEMFFGGFSGAIAFYPGRIIDSSLVPKTVLTDFRLSGNPVPIGGGSPLKQSIMTTDSITLPNEQNILSIEFSALSFFNAATNRYRYKLDRLDDDWHEVSADQRIVSYTRLPASTYTFEVQSATSRGPWSEPARLRIEILPAWYQTLWFRLLCSLALLCLLWALYIARLRQVTGILRLRHQERLLEREEIARDLHDTFFQAVQSLFLRFDTATHQLPLHSNARDTLEELLDDSDRVMAEGREMFLDIPKHEIKRRDLSDLVAEYCAEFAAAYPIEYRVEIDGEPRALEPMVMTELTKIAREALHNAFCHAEANSIEVEINYGKRLFRLRVRDNGRGFEPEHLQEKSGRRHLGLQNMRKRADSLSAKFDIWSRPGLGTEVETVIAAERAYSIKRRIWPFSRPNGKA